MFENKFNHLNILRSSLKKDIQYFFTSKNLNYEIVKTFRGERINVPTANCTIDLYYNNDGTTSINYQVGKNQELGLEFAEERKKYIDQDIYLSQPTVVLKVNHLGHQKPSYFLAPFKYDSAYTLKEDRIDPTVQSWTAQHKEYKDSLKIFYYPGTKRWMVQGKPLTCFQEFRSLINYLLQEDVKNEIFDDGL